MKTRKLFLSIFCLGALMLSACSGDKKPASSSSPSSSEAGSSDAGSSQAHEHQWDEHGVCPEDGAYRGETKAATSSDPLHITNLAAGAECYFRLSVTPGVKCELGADSNPNWDEAKTKLWLKNGSEWQNVTEMPVYDIPSNSDGYLYAKLVTKTDLASWNVWTSVHQHTGAYGHGFCFCGEYTGSTMHLNLPLVIESVTAGKYEFARITGLNPAERYKIEAETTASDVSAVYNAYASNDGQSFTPYDPFNPTSPVGATGLYLEFLPTLSGYQATFTMRLEHNVDETGYCLACGEFVGEILTYDVAIDHYFDENEYRYFKVEPTVGHWVNFSFGAPFDGTVNFYTRTAGGEITDLGQHANVPFKVPSLPDGYLYIRVCSNHDTEVMPHFGLLRVNGYGFDSTGYFVGDEVVCESENQIPSLRDNNRYFLKFDVEPGHTYTLFNKGSYSDSEYIFSGYNPEGAEYIDISDTDTFTVDNTGKIGGTHITYVVLMITPASNHDAVNVFVRIEGHSFVHGLCTGCGYYIGETLIPGEESDAFTIDQDNHQFFRFRSVEGLATIKIEYSGETTSDLATVYLYEGGVWKAFEYDDGNVGWESHYLKPSVGTVESGDWIYIDIHNTESFDMNDWTITVTEIE